MKEFFKNEDLVFQFKQGPRPMGMDGQTYTAQSAAVQLKAGYKYDYTLQINGAQMTVSSVTITDRVDNGTETINPSI